MLGIVSIVLSIVIFKLSNDTSEKLAEEAAKRAFDKRYGKQNLRSAKELDSSSFALTKEQCKILKKLLNKLIKKARRNSHDNPWVHAATFPIQLKTILSEEETVKLMYVWERDNLISWSGNLENSTKVFILKGELLSENFDSCKS